MIKSAIFTPFKVESIQLKNRVVKSATYEGLSKNGIVTDKLIEFHTKLIEGGVAMTTLAYCAVNEEGATLIK